MIEPLDLIRSGVRAVTRAAFGAGPQMDDRKSMNPAFALIHAPDSGIDSYTKTEVDSLLAQKATTSTLLSGAFTAVGSSSGNLIARGVDGKLPADSIPSSLLGGIKFQSVWNAATNTPTIPAASSDNVGWYYRVGTAGTTNIDGTTEWGAGDWVISNGTAWDKIDNSERVTSVAGKSGDVTLSFSDLMGSISNGQLPIPLNLVGTVSSSSILTITGASGQTGDLQRWESSAGALLARVAADGAIAATGISLVKSVADGGSTRHSITNTNSTGYADLFLFNAGGRYFGYQIGGESMGLTYDGLSANNLAKLVSNCSNFIIGTEGGTYPLWFVTNGIRRGWVTGNGNWIFGPSTTIDDNVSRVQVNGNISTTGTIYATNSVFSTKTVADSIIIDCSTGGITGITAKSFGVIKGYWAVATGIGQYFTDAVSGDLIFATASEPNRILFGKNPSSSTMAVSSSGVTFSGAVKISAPGTGSPTFGTLLIIPPAGTATPESAVYLESRYLGSTQGWYFGAGTGGGSPNNRFRIYDLTNGVEALDIVPGGRILVNNPADDGVSFLQIGGAVKASSSAIAVTSTDLLTLQNTALSTVSVAVQMSPRIRWSGSAWKTAATAASHTVDFIAEVLPVSGTAASGVWRIGAQIAAGGYTYPLTLTNAGLLTTLGGVTSTNGTFTGTLSVTGVSTFSNVQTVNRTNIVTTSTDGFVIANATAATSGVTVQYSPRFRLSGTAWNTTATAASNTINWVVEVRPNSGLVPTGTLHFLFDRNATGYTSKANLTSDGTLTLSGNIFLGVYGPSYASSFTLDPTLYGVFAPGIMTGNMTITMPSGTQMGQQMKIVLQQDGTGGRTLTWGGSNVRFTATASNTTLSTAANKTDVILLHWHSRDSKWDVIAFTQG